MDTLTKETPEAIENSAFNILPRTFKFDRIRLGPVHIPNVSLVVARARNKEIVIGTQSRFDVERLVVVTVEAGKWLVARERRKKNGMNVRKTKTVIQLHPAITDVKGPTNFIHYRWISLIANIEIKRN